MFFLGFVPEVRSLMAGFSLREMVHFCRILALLVFDAEERNLMLMEGGGGVMPSLGILEWRRYRVLRPNPVLGTNQSILVGCREVVDRLVTIVRIMNFAPCLEVLSSRKTLKRACPMFEIFNLLGHRVEQ